MPSPAISRFPVASVDDLPADIQQRIAEVQEKAGFVPNVFRALAWRAEVATTIISRSAMLRPGVSLSISASWYWKKARNSSGRQASA